MMKAQNLLERPMVEHYAPAPIVSPALDAAGLSDRFSCRLRHGFFTREGGVSTGLYAALNAGPGSSDEPENVAENRARIAAHLGVDATHLLSPYQFHSADVVVVDAPFSGERPRADAIVTATRGLAIGVVTADCGPLLFVDLEAGVIGAAHAGWQGAVGGVIENTIAAMEQSGAKRASMIAVLGPTISQTHYEVGADFEARLLARDTAGAAFFTPGQNSEKRQFDLPGYIMMRLQRVGVAGVDTGLCTYANPERFFSYRRTTHHHEPDYGRQISALCLE
jgi:polyphenol oxidase